MNNKIARISVLVLAPLVLVGSLIWIHELFDRFETGTRVEYNVFGSSQITQATSSLIRASPEMCRSIDSYSWVRSAKGDGREYVAVLMIGKNQNLCDFRVSLEKTMKTVSWNSKDLLMVWGESEMSVGRNFHEQEEMSAAVLRQTIVLIFSDQQISTRVHFDSPSGILPAQDWLNVFQREARREGVVPEISGGWEGVRSRWEKSEIGMHGNFSDNGIPAFTALVGRKDVDKFPAVIERCLRAASNVEEQLIPGRKFYFMKTPEKFVALGDYLSPLISVLSPIFVACLLSDYANFRSRIIGLVSLLATVVCVPLAILRPEIALVVNPIVGLVGSVVLIFAGKFLNS